MGFLVEVALKYMHAISKLCMCSSIKFYVYGKFKFSVRIEVHAKPENIIS